MLSNRGKRDRLLSLSNELFIIKKWDRKALKIINDIENSIFHEILCYAIGEDVDVHNVYNCFLKIVKQLVNDGVYNLEMLNKIDTILKKYLF